MTGCVFKRKLKSGISWGFSFFVGRDVSGKPLRQFKSGFPTKTAAAEALRAAITEWEAIHGKLIEETGILGTKTWAYVFRDQRRAGFSNRDAAEAALSTEIEKQGAAAVQREKDEQETQQGPAFEKFIVWWLDEHAARSCSPKTIERYRELSGYIIRELQQTPLNQITTSQIQKAIHHLEDHGGRHSEAHPAGRPLAPKTVRHIGTLLYTCLAEAERLDVLRIPHPMANKRVKLPKLVKRNPPVLDKDKLAILFARAKGTRLYPVVVLGAATGCRRGELLALQWTDIDPETGELTVSKSLEQTKAGLRIKGTKSGKPRKFSVPEWALEVLEQHKVEQDNDRRLFGADYTDNGLIFCQPNGGHYSPDRVGARVVELMRESGLNGVSLHDLRHSHASNLISRGVPVPVVAERLGHADQNLTMSIYSHALPADTRAAAKVWNDAMADVIGDSKKAGAPQMFARVCTEGRKTVGSVDSKRKRLAGTTGLEPATSDVTGRRSNQLNYVPEA